MWKASKVTVHELEDELNRLERLGYTILSASPVPGYSKFDIVVVAQKDHKPVKVEKLTWPRD